METKEKPDNHITDITVRFYAKNSTKPMFGTIGIFRTGNPEKPLIVAPSPELTQAGIKITNVQTYW